MPRVRRASSRYARVVLGEAEGRVALVTGAGSPNGIGFATARILAREGASLAIASTTERIHDRVNELQAEGAGAGGFVADLVDRAQVGRVVDEVTERFGRIDILVNNAGMVSVSMEPSASHGFIDLEDADWDRDLAMNLDTAFNVTKRVLPGMVERGWGRVVMVSSVTGPLVTYTGLAGYAAAKAGMDGLMRSVALEVASRGVTVNSVQPGFVATGSQTPEEHEVGKHTPIGRSGSAEEIGEVIAFLASDRARYVTGQTFVVDGGNVIQEAKGP
jgi:3-oxoacyl-[acyl-carrier protein] reductase